MSNPDATERALHATAADLPELAETLVSAFADDPVMCWLFDEPELRSDQLRAWMKLCLDIGMTRGHLYHAGGLSAVAIWTAPDVKLFDELWGARLAWLLKKLIGPRAEERMRAMAEPLAHASPPLPSFYLFMLGTRGESQGRGLGSILLEPILERCDAQGLGAHLESSNPRNISFYQRHGFEVTAEVRLGGHGPLVCPMYRPPRTPR